MTAAGAAPVLVACALDREAAAVRRRLDGSDGSGIRVAATGMGFEVALRAVEAALEGGLSAVVLCGLGGGCASGLRPGTVVVADTLLGPDGDAMALGQGALERAAVAAAVTAGARPGAIASLPAVVDSTAGREAVAGRGAALVETEAWPVARACRGRGVPLVVVRAVVDTRERPLGAAASTVRPGRTGPVVRDAAGLVARPRLWPALLQLAADARRAEGAAAEAAVAAARAIRAAT